MSRTDTQKTTVGATAHTCTHTPDFPPVDPISESNIISCGTLLKNIHRMSPSRHLWSTAVGARSPFQAAHVGNGAPWGRLVNNKKETRKAYIDKVTDWITHLPDLDQVPLFWSDVRCYVKGFPNVTKSLASSEIKNKIISNPSEISSILTRSTGLRQTLQKQTSFGQTNIAF